MLDLLDSNVEEDFDDGMKCSSREVMMCSVCRGRNRGWRKVSQEQFLVEQVPYLTLL